MSKSNKIILTLSIVVFIAVSMIVGIVAVFAADNTITRNVVATYNVVDANCSVSAVCVVGEDIKSFTMDATETGDKFVCFEKDNNKQTKTMMPVSDVKLNKENNYVVYQFKFINNGDNLIKASLVVENVEEKFVVEYSKDGVIWKDYAVRINVPASDVEVNYYVRISLLNADNSYNCPTNFNWMVCGEF